MKPKSKLLRMIVVFVLVLISLTHLTLASVLSDVYDFQQLNIEEHGMAERIGITTLGIVDTEVVGKVISKAAGAAFIPFATGIGMGVRIAAKANQARKTGNLFDMAKATQKASQTTSKAKNAGNWLDSTKKMFGSKTGAVLGGKISHFKSDPSFIKKAKELQTGPSGTDVKARSYDEAHALMKKAFPEGLTKVPGAGPNTRPISQSDDLFTKGTYKTDFLRDPSTNRIYGETERSTHASNPHINIMTRDGRKVNIIIDDLGK